MNKQLQCAQARVEEICARLESALGIDGWVDVHYTFVEGGGDRDVQATTAAAWEYRDATITWYLDSVARMDDEEIETVALHELVHVLIAPVTSLISDNNKAKVKLIELSTESVARAFRSVLGR